MTLSDFLLARYAEDEAVAKDAAAMSEGGSWWVDPNARASGKHWVYATGEKFTDRGVAEHIARHDPAYALADLEAKRRIVEESARLLDGKAQTAESAVVRLSMRWVLQTLALPYADHPDYREEWKP